MNKLSKPIVVVVPVFNAYENLVELVRSIEKFIPKAIDQLSFIFSDDNSQDPRMTDFFLAQFFCRQDVLVLRNKTNLGFVKNVNNAIANSPKDSDIVILNSDTVIFNEIFSILQKEAYSEPDIASVTPLTNNGTIASLINWPNGGSLPGCLSSDLLVEAIDELSLPSHLQISAPTGVGFCMYMRRDAINEIGVFDEIYGRGYGEECDWCCRAIKKGFKHILSAKAFVMHAGSCSFTDGKFALMQKNSKVLAGKHKEYNGSVRKYLSIDPLKFYRISILLNTLRKSILEKRILLMVLHKDPDNHKVGVSGGTERHVRTITTMLLNNGDAVITMFPDTIKGYRVRCSWNNEQLFDEHIDAELILNAIFIAVKVVDYLHIHHILNWDKYIILEMLNALPRGKVLTIHDFYFICRSLNLLNQSNQQFCQVESDSIVCNDCHKLYRDNSRESIDLYRFQSANILKQIDCILFPSESLIPYFARAFKNDWEFIRDKIKVLPHDLNYIYDICGKNQQNINSFDEKLVVFIGAISETKGSLQVIAAIPQLKKNGFTVKIFGQIYPSQHLNLLGVEIIPYDGIEELQNLCLKYNPAFFSIPSVTHESFCYSFYEGLILAKDAIPIVGPFGNPADVIKQQRIGVVMQSATAESLVLACLDAKERHDELLERKKEYVSSLREAPRNYYHDYQSCFINPNDKGSASAQRELCILATQYYLNKHQHVGGFFKNYFAKLKMSFYECLLNNKFAYYIYKNFGQRIGLANKLIHWFSN